MKRKYLSPFVEVVASLLKDRLMGHSYGWADAKEQTFENEETLFNTDTKNIWAEEDEETPYFMDKSYLIWRFMIDKKYQGKGYGVGRRIESGGSGELFTA